MQNLMRKGYLYFLLHKRPEMLYETTACISSGNYRITCNAAMQSGNCTFILAYDSQLNFFKI